MAAADFDFDAAVVNWQRWAVQVVARTGSEELSYWCRRATLGVMRGDIGCIAVDVRPQSFLRRISEIYIYISYVRRL